MTRSALIRDASRRSLDEGTQWRDRLGKWLDMHAPGLTLAKLVAAKKLLDDAAIPEDCRMMWYRGFMYRPNDSRS